jgi:hypothetical protein
MVARYLKLAAFSLLCGGVGPLFVVVYFFLSPDEQANNQWMLWCGIAITVLDVIWPLGLIYYQSKSAARTELLEQQGVLALAEIVGLAETGTTINDAPVVKLDLDISGRGFAPFNDQKRVRVSLIQQPIITGRKLVVLVDPTDNSYQIDWQRSAWIAGLVPLRITSAEENRTYDLTGQVGPLMEFFELLKSHRITLGERLDLRAYPEVRKQALAIARRAGAAEQAPASPQAPTAAPSVPVPSAPQRMQDLETLRATGAITEAEYAAKRQQIISSL